MNYNMYDDEKERVLKEMQAEKGSERIWRKLRIYSPY